MSPTIYVFVLALVHLISAAWLLGGYYSLAPLIMGISGWGAFFVSIFFLCKDLHRRKSNPALHKIWLLWMGFVVFLLISLLNPSYSEITVKEGIIFAYNAPVTWLPSVVSQSRSFPMIFQFTGALALGWSMLALFRSRRLYRNLLFICVLNAALLAFLGTFLTLVKAESPLGFFCPIKHNHTFFASITYHNHWVAFASLALFTVTGLFVYRFKKSQHYQIDFNRLSLLGVLAFFLLLSLLLVESRTGLLVLCIYLICLVISFVFLRSRHGAGKTSFKVGILVAIGVLVLAILSVIISGKEIEYTVGKYKNAWHALMDPNSEVDSFRFNHGPKIVLALVKNKPMLGWGWGSYHYAMKRYAPKYIGDYAISQYAHCDWLQFLAELGVVGFFLFVTPIIYLVFKYREPDTVATWIRVGLMVILFMALFEYPLSNPAVLSHFMIGLIASIGLKAATAKMNHYRAAGDMTTRAQCTRINPEQQSRNRMLKD